MNKRIVLCALLFVSCFMAFAKAGIKDMMIITSFENLKEDKVSWVKDGVSSRLESNLNTYTDIKIVDTTSSKELKIIQKSKDFGQKEMKQIRDLKLSNTALFLVIRKTKSTYSLSAKITNLSTSEIILSAVSKSYDSLESLFSMPGCAVDDLTVKICSGLGYSLSKEKRAVLLDEEVELTASQKVTKLKKEEQECNRQIKALDAELDRLSKLTDEASLAKQADLRAKKIVAEQQYELNKMQQKRLEEKAANLALEKEKNAARSEKQRQRIAETEKVLQGINAEYASENLQKEPVMRQLNIIEAKRKSIYVLRKDLEPLIQECYDNEQAQIAKTRKKLDDDIANPRKAISKNGVIIDSIRIQMEEDFVKTKEKFAKERDKEIAKLRKDELNEEKKHFKGISEDLALLQNTTVSSLSGDLEISFDFYDAELCGWKIYLEYKSDGVTILDTSSFLPYEALTNKKPVTKIDDPNFNTYLDEVDFYDSLLVRGEPLLIFELVYDVKESGIEYQSRYDFNFKDFKFVDTRNLVPDEKGRKPSPVYKSLTLNQKTTYKQLIPVVDLRSEAEKQSLAEKQANKERKEQRKKEMEIESEQRRQEAAERNEIRRQEAAVRNEEFKRASSEIIDNFVEAVTDWQSDAYRFSAGIDFGFNFGCMPGSNFSLLINYPINSNVFLTGDIKFFNTDYTNKNPLITEPSLKGAGFVISAGYNRRFGRDYRPNFFCALGLGYYGLGYKGSISEVDPETGNSISKEIDETYPLFPIKTTIGLDFPIHGILYDAVVISSYFTFDYVIAQGFAGDFNISILVDLQDFLPGWIMN